MTDNLYAEIKRLKAERRAVILAHNYQPEEVQDVADYTGDSLGLSIAAAKTDANVIVFCGVYFMAETAKILSSAKKVLMPEIIAGCPMADMLNVPKLKKLREEHPRAKVVCYVNSTAAVKAEADICCTSANAVKVVSSLADADEIIFVPDKYLGMYTASKVKDKKFFFSDGFCPTHMKITPQQIQKLREEHPKAAVIVHPECRPEVIAEADAALSTEGMIEYSKKSKAKEIIVGTEIGMLHRLKKEVPGKTFYPASRLAVCPNMKLTTLEKVLWSLEDMKTEVMVPDDIADRARSAIQKMIEVGRQD
ncbi:MAG TPA: quinolinate synthase NadA [Candidatus Omnitrophota bacterium]|nr:quinolinate synthase NadA [Candidatus Omnitrophota bacterium]